MEVNLVGEAGYDKRFGSMAFVGNFENKSVDKIVTKFVIKLSHEDGINDKGDRIIEYFEQDNLWIIPGKKHNIAFIKLKFVPKESRLMEDGKLLYNWSIEKIYGVGIKLR